MSRTFKQIEAERIARLVNGTRIRDEHGMAGAVVSRRDDRAVVECADGLVREYVVSRVHVTAR